HADGQQSAWRQGRRRGRNHWRTAGNHERHRRRAVAARRAPYRHARDARARLAGYSECGGRNMSGHDNDIEKPVNVGNPQIEWVSDLMAETVRRLDLKYLTMNPGASYRGFHDSLVNYLGNRDPQMLLTLNEDH